MERSNSNLLVCCNILSRIESLLGTGTRVQMSKENLSTIGEYLTKAIKYIDPKLTMFGSELVVFGNTAASIESTLNDSSVKAITNDAKTYLCDKLQPAIIMFKINVGKYLTDHEFDYSPGMDKLLQNIIETCLDNGYYFGY